MKQWLKHPVLVAGLGATLCITLLAGLGGITRVAWIMAPFGATMVLLFALPDSPLAQPRNILGGHVLTAIIGVMCLLLLGVHAWSLGIAVGLAVMLMMLTKTVHPPAGANPLLIMLTGESWGFVITPVTLGAMMIIGFGWLYHNYIAKHAYPKQWF